MIRPVQHSRQRRQDDSSHQQTIYFMELPQHLLNRTMTTSRKSKGDLSSSPPDRQAQEHDRRREKELAGDADPIHLRSSHRDPAVFLLFRQMEIKSSSEASQSIAFIARSGLPLKPMKEFSAHKELPTTTKRPWEFSLPVLYVPAAAIVSGPFLFPGSFSLMLVESSTVVARLLADESKSLSTAVLSRFCVERTRQWKSSCCAFQIVHDRMRIVARHQRDLGTKARQLTDRVQIQKQIFLDVTPQLESRLVSASLSAMSSQPHFQRRINQAPSRVRPSRRTSPDASTSGCW